MAGKIDITKLAQRLAELNTKRGGEGSPIDFIDIKDGRNVVRVLPPRDGQDWFAKEVWVHYGVGKKDGKDKGTMVVCPTTYGDDKPCPVCELAKELYKLSKKKGDNYSKQAGEIKRKKRVYYNAIDRSENLDNYELKEVDGEKKWFNKETEEESSPVKILGTGVSVYKEILSIITDPEYGDITDPKEGLDVIITKSGTGFDTDYKVKTVRKESEIGFAEWESCLHDLEPFAKVKTYDEIAAIMEGKAVSESSGQEDTAEEDDNTPVHHNESTPESTESSEGSADTEDNLQAEIQEALKRRRGK